MNTWKAEINDWLRIFNVDHENDFDPNNFYFWDKNKRLISYPTPIPDDRRVKSQADVLKARFQALLINPREHHSTKIVQIAFKDHPKWGLVLPSPSISIVPNDLNSLNKEIEEQLPKVFKKSNYSYLEPYGGILSFKKSPTNQEPNAYFFPFYIIRTTVGDRLKDDFHYADRDFRFISKNKLEDMNIYQTPNGDVYRGVERVFPGWNIIDRFTFTYDFAFSYAGEQRVLVEKFVNIMRSKTNDITIFYDRLEDLIGKRLPAEFYSIFYKRSKYVIIFMSNEYEHKIWTTHEFQAAKDRLLEEKGTDYILPLSVNGSVIEELDKFGYQPVDETNIELMVEKLISA